MNFRQQLHPLRDIAHGGSAIFAERVNQRPLRPDGQPDRAAMAMQEVFSQRTFDFVFIELAGAGIGIAAVDLINAETMLCEQVVIGVKQTDVGERRRVVLVFESMHLGDSAHGGHDGGAQFWHHGEIEIPYIECVAGNDDGTIAEFEVHFAGVSARRCGIGHEYVDPVGLIHDVSSEFLRRHVERHKSIWIITDWQRRHWCGF